MPPRKRVLLALAGCAALASWHSSEARADDKRDGIPAATRRQASALFSRGEALYRIGDFARAAELFEEAYALAPHPDILWNAARSFEKAGAHARAANHYATYIGASAETASDRREAVKALDRLSKKLGRLHLHPPEATVFVDGERVTSPEWYVTPGSHVVKLVVDGYEDQQNVAIEAGGVRSLSAVPPAPPPAPPRPEETGTDMRAGGVAPPGPGRDTNVAASPSGGARGWSPIVFVSGAVLTAVATGVAVGFGIDTLNQRSEFDASPSTDRFDAGREKQARTNVAIGVAAGLGVLTAVTGIWLVDWSKKPDPHAKRVGLAVGPSFAGVSGSFD